MCVKYRRFFNSLALLAVATIWSVIVWRTIPAGAGGGDIGPRAFPLLLGCALVVLALILLFQEIRAARSTGEKLEAFRPANDEDADSSESSGFGIVPVVLTFGHIILYGFLMQKIGFVLATLVVITSVMVFCVKERSPLRIAAMSVGITFVCWLVFGKILGVYLANGSWISLG